MSNKGRSPARESASPSSPAGPRGAINGDADNAEDFSDIVGLSPTGRCATMCIFGCISIMGCRSSVVRRLSFYPPFPAGYSLEDGQLYIQDSIHGGPAGGVVRTAGSEQLKQRPKPQEGQESIQQLLARNHLPERVKVCFIRKARRKQLAAVLLWSTAGVPSSCNSEEEKMQFALSNRPLVIFSHGNSTDIGFMFGLHYRMCFRCHVNVLAYDYSGYGWSDGRASEAALYSDIRAVFQYAVKQLSVPPQKIILYGHSVGSGPSCDFAAKKKGQPLGGLILHSPISSGLRLFISDIDKAPWFDAFQNAEKLRKVHDVPMLLIHGQLDRQVPFTHALKLEASCREADAMRATRMHSNKSCCLPVTSMGYMKALSSEPLTPRNTELHHQRVQTWWVENADHNDIEHKAGDEYYVRISAFVDFCAKWHSQCDSTTR
ncbi:alpha/beta hydrolase domain-containing protein 17C [Cyclospora cayetanensis]|uniref:Alpha/beta hydrolase domain-containing protein 17C n=1 Tax=Cyclospora cayetanensis TaxID=88456 RepID=A0A6P6RQB0_9EIME|nr:alpha/beta hydrolase domain-containing protein 17C [Cyclospora cayetanensis]